MSITVAPVIPAHSMGFTDQMVYLIPPTVAEVQTKFRLKPEHVEQVVPTSKNVTVRNEIGGRRVVVTDIKAFVAEVRALRGKPMWKR